MFPFLTYFPQIVIHILVGLLLGALIGFTARQAHALSLSGAWAATIVGGLIFGLGGLAWAILLLVFFISSSAFSRLFARRKAVLNEKFSKGSQRDWGQVLANGGLGAVLAVAHGWLPGQAWPWIAYAGAMAAVNADTWATELGVLSRSLPRLITTGRAVERGTSGAISLAGSLAALAGAGIVGVSAAIFTALFPASTDLTRMFSGSPVGAALEIMVAAILGGLAGSFFDSFLGATVQAIYYCPTCKKETERHPLHTCGTPTSLVRGWSWFNNDLVNFACSLAGALAAAGIYLLLQG